MTCVQPETLIKKYGEFAYGDPRMDDHRVVLENSMKSNVQDAFVFEKQTGQKEKKPQHSPVR